MNLATPGCSFREIVRRISSAISSVVMPSSASAVAAATSMIFNAYSSKLRLWRALRTRANAPSPITLSSVKSRVTGVEIPPVSGR